MKEIWSLVICCALGFALSALMGLWVVPALKKAHIGQSIKENGPAWHMSKQGTPTMGGVMFILAALIVSLVWWVWQGDASALGVFAFALVFGLIGFVDDAAKLRHKENTGLSAPAKFLLQLAAAILFTVAMRYAGHLTPDLTIPFVGAVLHLPWPLYMVFAALVMVGTVNAVNLTDGVDGLSSSVTMPVMLVFAALSLKAGRLLGFGAFASAMLGGLIGFYLYNHYPARVFMGDTGSLFMGGAVCGLAFAFNMPLLLVFVGFVYICETVSDIIQVVYFKLTHGKRFFLMAPLHHHYEKKGWSEKKVVRVFATVSALMCILGYAGVMNLIR